MFLEAAFVAFLAVVVRIVFLGVDAVAIFVFVDIVVGVAGGVIILVADIYVVSNVFFSFY